MAFTPDPALEAEIARLGGLGLAELRDLWAARLGVVLLGLFNKVGAELKDAQTIEAAGVKPRDELLLRPSSVRGG